MGYVWAGYGVTVGSIAAYAIWIVVRGRKLGGKR